MSTRLIDITDIEQGTIDDYGNQNSSTRVRSAGRYAVNLGQQIKISVESNSNIKTNVMLYADSTTNRALWDSGWFDNGESIDITRYTDDAKYIRICLKKSNNSNISPEDIVSCRVEVKEADITYSWHIDDDYGLINENFYAPFGKDFQKPYPKSIWYVDEEKGLVNGLLVEPYESKAGAFMNASNLQTVYIPRTCKKIGEWAFRNTALKKVCIAADCTYYPTSFPDGCEIEFYGGGGDFEQLYDSDNNMLLDSTGAMIYVRSDD